MPTNGLDQPGAQVLLRVWHHDESWAPGMHEHMMRNAYPVQHPARLPQVAYLVGAGHVCIVHIGLSTDKVLWAVPGLSGCRSRSVP